MFHLSFCLLQWFPRIVNVTCDCWLNCLLSLPFLPLNILFRAGRSLHFCLLCKGPFSEYFQIYRLQLSTLFRFVFNPFPSCFLLTFLCSNFLVNTLPASVLWVTNVILSFLLVSSRDRAIIWNFYLEPNSNIHGFLLIRISKPTIRQQEQNMIK